MNNHHPYDQESVLVRDFQRGDDIAFLDLYHRYKQPIYGFILKMVGDLDAAKDIFQTVFLHVYEQANHIDHPESFRAWLYSIARNESVSYLRHSTHLDRSREEPDEVSPDGDPTPLTSAERTEEIQLLNRAVADLRPEYREVVILRDYQQLSYREIAAILRIEERLVKSRLFTARRRLYESLRPYFTERSTI